MEYVAIISGLIGALLSAGLSFWVRLILYRKSQRDAECKIAYIHLVRVSELVAAEVVIRNTIKIFVPNEVLKELISSDGAFGPSHKISVFLAEALNRWSPEEIQNDPSLRAIPRLFSTMLESAKQSRLSPEQLSKFPRDTVLAWHRLQNYNQQLSQCLELWSAYFESNVRFWVTPEGIHDQWRTLERFASVAKELSIALVRHGAATLEQAAKLLTAQVNEMHQSLVSKKEHRKCDDPRVAVGAGGFVGVRA